MTIAAPRRQRKSNLLPGRTAAPSTSSVEVLHEVYFYPKADTPGCTTQACGLRDISGEVGDTVIIGISPDKPAKLKKFDEKYGLGFTLLSDEDHAIAEKYGLWVEKKNYGKTYMGVQRAAFLIDESGKVAKAWPKISPADTPKNLLKALADG